MPEKKKKNTLQKAGSLTMIPYVLDALGYEGAAQMTGYPFDKKGNKKPEFEFKNSMENMRKQGKKVKNNYEDDPLSLITKAMGFKEGGAVPRKKPKMGCVMKGRGGSYKGQK